MKRLGILTPQISTAMTLSWTSKTISSLSDFYCFAAVIAYVAYNLAYKPLCGASASSYRPSLIGLWKSR